MPKIDLKFKFSKFFDFFQVQVMFWWCCVTRIFSEPIFLENLDIFTYEMAFLLSIRRFDHQKISDYSDVKHSENSENPIFFSNFLTAFFSTLKIFFRISFSFLFQSLKIEKKSWLSYFNTPGGRKLEKMLLKA